MSNQSKTYLLLLFASLGLDYWIASFLASGTDDVWFYFWLLLLIPAFFAMKTNLIRLVLWLLLVRHQDEKEIFQMLVDNDFPAPNEYELVDLNGPEDYLRRTMDDYNLSDETRKLSTLSVGGISWMNASNQFLGKIFWSKTFLKAMRRYSIKKSRELGLA